jgi:hypothetical protein
VLVIATDFRDADTFAQSRSSVFECFVAVADETIRIHSFVDRDGDSETIRIGEKGALCGWLIRQSVEIIAVVAPTSWNARLRTIAADLAIPLVESTASDFETALRRARDRVAAFGPLQDESAPGSCL